MTALPEDITRLVVKFFEGSTQVSQAQLTLTGFCLGMSWSWGMLLSVSSWKNYLVNLEFILATCPHLQGNGVSSVGLPEDSKGLLLGFRRAFLRIWYSLTEVSVATRNKAIVTVQIVPVQTLCTDPGIPLVFRRLGRMTHQTRCLDHCWQKTWSKLDWTQVIRAYLFQHGQQKRLISLSLLHPLDFGNPVPFGSEGIDGTFVSFYGLFLGFSE